MTKDEYGNFVLRYKGCGACFPMYHTLSRFEKMWFTAIQQDVAELEKENAELKNRLEHRNCLDCSNHSSKLRMRTFELERKIEVLEKANEWHYPSKGELPKEDKRYLCKIKAFVGSGITYECFDYDSEYSSWKGASGEVIAWKEIVLPELPKENE